MHFDNFLYERESNARALRFWIQFVEETKDALMMFGVNANAIIFYKENRFAIILAALTDFNKRIRLIAHVFRRVLDQVLQNLYQTLTISMDRWQVWLSLNCNTTCGESPVNNIHRVTY